MPAPNWNTSGEWDVLKLGGKVMPGVAQVEISLPSGLDVQKAKGTRKARVVDTGTPAAILRIELTLLPSDMPALEAALPTLRPRGATSSIPELSIVHPNAALWGINSVKISKLESPMPTRGGLFVLRIDAFEHLEQPKKIKKPPPGAAKGDWNVQPKIDALNTSPGASGANEANFSEAGEIPGSGF